MRLMLIQCFCAFFVPFSVIANLLYSENFSSDELTWITSKSKDDLGEFQLIAGEGIKTSQDARFYAISQKLDTPISNKDSKLIIQYSVRHPQNIDCGGGYIKLLDDSYDPTDFNGKTPYLLMFGPDICGSTKKVHTIFNYDGKEVHKKSEVRCEDDTYSHMYTLKLNPDNTYEIEIDGESKAKGTLETDFPFLADKRIKDPKAKKPSDWVDDETIDDPEDSKPEDWDQPKTIPDADDKKPDDWDDDTDGDWEPKQIDNPDYKGEWKPKQIPNPEYKGPWKHPMIDNPEYKPDSELYLFRKKIGGVGFDLWQVKSGTIFSNILITDDEDLAKKQVDEVNELREAQKAKEEAEREVVSKDSETESNDVDEDDDDREDTDTDTVSMDDKNDSSPPPIVEDHDEL